MIRKVLEKKGVFPGCLDFSGVEQGSLARLQPPACRF